ncbi:glycosyltransferase [Alteromonas sp. ASW11-36]|uniref:Glycosyltransferase n=1 Tax=Alteromonas arenosi TaxID=3055817 RepID=A0ABT7SSZ7_9ALTE|nr:glycosyltransferase [Alteromonas sp. ASW11-36]MDM7859312.1 glycosyltransferase [Alteromonas sp. ASW11-36]
MKSNKISVVIPLYNKAQHVMRTLESVAKQTLSAHEIIVVDDGSTDDGAQIVAEANIPNLHLISQTNAGVSVARNTGIEAATGDFIAFIDADDEWMPMFLEQMMELAERFPIAGVFASRYQMVVGENYFRDVKFAPFDVPPEGGLMSSFYDLASRGDLPFHLCSMVVRKSSIDSVGGFPVGETMGEDQDLMCRLAENYHVAYSPSINYLYHTDATNRACVNHLPAQELPFSQRIMARLEQQPSVDTKQRIERMRFCAAHICHLAQRNLRNGNVSAAWNLLKDKRCWLKPKHKILLTLGCVLFYPFKANNRMAA